MNDAKRYGNLIIDFFEAINNTKLGVGVSIDDTGIDFAFDGVLGVEGDLLTLRFTDNESDSEVTVTSESFDGLLKAMQHALLGMRAAQ
jgi:hypothetical protein